MELKTAWGSRTSIGSDGENNLVHVETVDTVESSTLPETSSPRQASNGNEQSKHEAEIETVQVEKGTKVTFKCITNNIAETQPKIKEGDGKTFEYVVKHKLKKRTLIEWVVHDNSKEEKSRDREITRHCTSNLKIILRIFKKSKGTLEKEIETKAWQLKLTKTDDQSDEQQGSSKDDQSDQQQGSSKDDESDEQQGSTKDDLWDVCEVKQAPWKGVDYHKTDGVDKANKLLRIVSHFLIFLIVTSCSITSIGSLQILLSLLGNENMQRKEMTDSRGVITVYLFLILVLPDFIACLYFFLQSRFKNHDHKRNKVPRERRFILKEENGGNTRSNNKATCILFVATEICHCFGINGFVFFVCPYLSAVEMYLFPVAFTWPLVSKSLNKTKCFTIIRAILILIVIISIPAIILLYKSDQLYWWTIVCMCFSAFFVPFRWLRNVKCCGIIDCSSKCCSIVDYSAKLQSVVSFGRVIISSVMFVINLLLVQLVSKPFSFEIPFSNSQNSGFIFNWTSVYTKGCTSGLFEYMMLTNPEKVSLQYFVSELFLIHLVVTYLLYYFAVLACRICMQKFCFFVPLLIAEFVLYPISLFARIAQEISCQLNEHEYILIAPFYLLFFCHFWFLNHIFIKQTKVMPFAKSLFTLPNYCSPIAVLSLLHSRKIEDTDDDVKTDGNKINHQTNPSSSRNGEIENQPERIIIESESQTSNTDYDTMIYICATMWHETMEEMKNLIFSILRLDYDHALNSNSRLIKEYKAEDKELFQFEGHIFFDDAFECNKRKDGQKNVNKFVRQLKFAIGQAVSQFYNSNVKLEKPKCLNTLYGKRLEWKLPGQNSLFIHLKDKDKIRHKKRWSQVMYLYYLLGFKLIQSNASDICDTKIDKQEIKVKNKKFSKKVENTFILALDGDVKFYPVAIKRLLGRMKKNASVAASSGRIVPSGTGPVVWYQRFEYAVSHWLQKTTEHIFGCVLCSPGCFTLFRAKSLLSGNIMHEYTKMATTPREVVQYNLGEDRWFCTLLLKEGFRVEYFAAAHASTSVPKEFDALFTQRKRWIPSTIANLFDILQNSKQIRKNNQNVSYLYVIYQTILLMATILGPSTILLAMDAALQVVFGFQSWHVYVFVYGPPIFYIFLCLKLNSKLQLSIGVALSLAYSLLMLSVFIGTVVNIVKEGWYTPSAVFLYVLFGVFILAGLMHINEFFNLIHIFIYFIFLPLGYLFIPIYAICNMNDISWGTRENQNPEFVNTNTNDVNENQKTDVKPFVDANKQLLQEFNKFIFEKNQKPSSTYNILNIFRMSYYLLQFKLFESVESRIKQIKEGEANEITKESSMKQQEEEADSSKNINEDDWYKSDGINEEYKKEETFWKKFQEKYVFPTNKSGLDKEILNKFRNKSATMFFFFNAVWIVIVSSMNEVKHELNIRFNIADGQPVLIEPLGFSFLLIFALLLFIQVIGMTLHRYSTFLHVIAETDVRNKNFFDNIKIKKHVETLLSPIQDSEKINENQQTEDAQRNERRDDGVVQSSSTCPRNESSTNCQNIHLTDIFHKRMKGKPEQKQYSLKDLKNAVEQLQSNQITADTNSEENCISLASYFCRNKKVNSERTEDAQENERHKDESVPSQSTGPRNESSTNPQNINQVV